MIEELHKIFNQLPGVQEIIDGHGHVAFKVKRKSIARLSGYSNELLSIKTDLETQEFLVARRPYFKSSHIGRHGWVTHKDGEPKDWIEIEGLLVSAYKNSASKRAKE